MQKPLFRFVGGRQEDGTPPEIQVVRRQFDVAQMLQDVCLALAGVPAERHAAVIRQKLDTDIASLRKLAQDAGVVVRQPDWFVAILRG